MRMQGYTPRKKKRSRVFFVLISLLIAVGVVWYFTDRDSDSETTREEKQNTDSRTASPDQTKGQTKGVVKAQMSKEQADKPAPGVKGMTAGLAESIGPSPITVTRLSKDKALAALREGLELFSKNAKNADLLRARTLLNQAYLSGQLAQPQAIQARKALEDLANRTVLRRNTYVNPKDPYMRSYTFHSGDWLHSKRKGGRVTKLGVIAKNNLNVPAGVIVWVNGLRNPTKFRAGVSYKLLVGPFHMVVYKSKFAADLFLRDLFVRRIPICLGKAETPTPEGYFRLVQGGKTPNSPYYPPAETGLANVAISPGQPGYPLGPGGLNMKIEGLHELGTNILASQSCAIHGTNDPSSIGQAASRGCLRLRNDDMRFVYGAFQDYAAPDDPHATWTRWSTITIRP